MTTKKDNQASTADREIVTSRLLDAPRELVWKAWTDPQHVGEWWGPNGFTTTTYLIEVKPGGIWRFCMHGPDGRDYENQITFIEIVEPERLVYKHGGEKEVSFQTTVNFEKDGDKTRLTMRAVFPNSEARDFVIKEYHADEGAKQHIQGLVDYLPMVNSPRRPFVISRTFDAPRDLMWKALTQPEHMKEWYGPKGFDGTVAKMDFRPGGYYHYCLRGPDGMEMWGKLVYREIDAPKRLVYINSFSDEKGSIAHHPMSPTWPLEMHTTLSLHEHDGKTTLTIRWIPINATDEQWKTFDEGRAGMTGGWTGSLDQLTEYLAKAQSNA